MNADGSIFHLHLTPAQLAERVILVGDPERVTRIGQYLEERECDVTNREYHSITGRYRGKRLSVISHGIGCGNMDIVLNELDALANINFETRTVNPRFQPLTLVRTGTSGGLQPNVPLGTHVAARQSIGFDGTIYFYAGHETIRDTAFEAELIRQLDWPLTGIRPYVVSADRSLTAQIAQNDILCGVTLTANGFYAPQGRELRLPLSHPTLHTRIKAFRYNDRPITNYEMESAALAGLAALMQHCALTVCCIIAGRVDMNVNTDYHDHMSGLIEKVLERI